MAVNKKALNLEMLQIAGFTYTGGIWSYPDGVTVDNGVPFFPESFDECLKWLRPKLVERNICIRLGNSVDNIGSFWCHLLEFKELLVVGNYHGEDKNPALAFCLAVKGIKMIKGERK